MEQNNLQTNLKAAWDQYHNEHPVELGETTRLGNYNKVVAIFITDAMWVHQSLTEMDFLIRKVESPKIFLEGSLCCI